MDVNEEREQLEKFDPEEREYISELLDEIEQLQGDNKGYKDYCDVDASELITEVRRSIGRIDHLCNKANVLNDQVKKLKTGNDKLKTFPEFVISSIQKTHNIGYVFTNSAENILRAAKSALPKG